MNTITVNGVDFKVETDHTNIAICDNQTDRVLIEATIDHNSENIIINVFVEDDCESVSYYEFVNNTDDLVQWMANRLFN